MKTRNILIIVLAVLVILLTLSNIYFIRGTQEDELEIIIGVPARSENGDSLGEDFTRSAPLENSEERKAVIIALLNAVTMDAAAPEDEADAVLWISDPGAGMLCKQYSLWLEVDSVVLTDGGKYKVIDSAFHAEQLKQIVEAYIQAYR